MVLLCPLSFHIKLTISHLNFEEDGTEFITNARKTLAMAAPNHSVSDIVSPFDSDVKVLSEVVSSAEVRVTHIFFKVWDATISKTGFKSSSQLIYTLSKSNFQ